MGSVPRPTTPTPRETLPLGGARDPLRSYFDGMGRVTPHA